MSKGRILMCISRYHGIGGQDIVINNLCNGLEKIGYETTIGAFSFDQNPPDNIQKVEMKKLSMSNDFTKFDIIHNHQTTMNYYTMFNKKPVIFHYHGTFGAMQRINLRSSLLLCRNRISMIISVSNTALEHLKGIKGKIPATVVYNGVDTNFYNTDLSSIYKKGDPQLLFVGRLFPNKNVETIINAMNLITEWYPSAHLQIVGDGPNYKNVKRLIEKKNLQSKVELTGKLYKDELRLRYSSCDFYISASSLETFAIPVLEAMSCGKPALLSDISAHKELINTSKAGMTFSTFDGNQIRDRLKEMYEKRSDFVSNARKFAEKYDWSVICKQVAGVYDEIMS